MDDDQLVYMRARYYDPLNGRFVSEDPERDGFNFYSYCDNNPNSASDFSGKNQVPDFLVGLMLFVVGAVMFMGAGSLSTLTTKIQEGQLASILRIKGLSEEVSEEFTKDLEKIIATNLELEKSAKVANNVKNAGAGLMAVGAAKAITAIMGYNLMCQGLISDIDNVDGPDILGTVFG